MNQEQLKRLANALEIVDVVVEEETEKLDNMQEKFSETEKYREMEERRDRLQEAKEILEEFA